MIVGLIGRRRAGKDTAGAALIEDGFFQIRFADGLKTMLSALFEWLDMSDRTIKRMIEGDLKEVPVELLGGKTTRFAMQTLGTNWGRELVGEDIWVNTALARATRYDRSVITDCRFPNEVSAIKAAGGVVVRIVRPGNTPLEDTPFFASRADLYYAAGLIEGEGYFKSLPRDRYKSGKAPELGIRIQMSDREPLDRLTATIGGRITGPYKSRRINTKPLFSWHLQRRAEVVAVTKALLPLLSPRCAAAAQRLLDADASYPRGSNCNYSHVSERVEELPVDAEITNDGSVADLHLKVRQAVGAL
jgi:hypothetical protein